MFGIVIPTILIASLSVGTAQRVISNGVGGAFRLQRTFGGYPIYPGYLEFPGYFGYPGFPAYPGYPGYPGYYNHQLGNGLYGLGLQGFNGPLLLGSPGRNYGLELAGGYGSGYYGGYNGLFGGFDGGFNRAYGVGPNQGVGTLPNTMNGFQSGIVPSAGYAPLVTPTVKKVFNQVF